MADPHESSRFSMDWLPSRGKNPYGFNVNHYSFRRFATLISMDKESSKFQDIMNDLNDLRKRFLSIDYRPTEQISSFQPIENKLKRRYPHVFEGKNGQKHLYFALHVIMNDHVNERSDIKRRLSVKRKDASAPKNKKRSAASINIQRKEPIETAKTIDLTDEQNINSIIRNIEPIVPLPPNSNCCIVSRPAHRAIPNLGDVEKAPTSSQAFRRHPSPPSQYTSGTSNTQGHASGSSHPNRAIAIQNPPKEEDVPTAIGPAEIYKFLSTCQPPMTRYLRCFVDFGCVTNAYLRSVSRGRAEQRYKLLKMILESDSRDAAVSPSEMDIAVLEYHFDTYFVDD